MSPQFDQLKSSLDRFAAAWKSNDGAALGSHFVDEGTLINPFGQLADGRAAVAAMYSDYFTSILRNTATSIKLASVRPIDSNHVFADSEQTITAPDGSTVMVVHLTALMRRDGDNWRFVDARPYTLAVVPG